MLIIATVGPSTKEKRVLKDIIHGGANVLRFNFSHGKIEEFNKTIKMAREIKRDIHIMQDLAGSKIRVSDKLSYIVKLYNEEEVIFLGEDLYKNDGNNFNYNNKKLIPLNIKSDDLNNQNIREISMKDNSMNFKIVSISDIGIIAQVIKGGIVRAGKGCNIKGFPRENLGISEKDKRDLSWGIKNKVDIICQSFVEDKEDVRKLKACINSVDGIDYNPKIWAKIETPKAINNIGDIIKEVDGVMICRGDLIPESAIILTPIYEEEALRRIRGKDKDIIIATHLLNSMKSGRSAEISEVESIYNHIKEGANGFLLAGETSVGKAPIKTVEFMSSLVKKYKESLGING